MPTFGVNETSGMPDSAQLLVYVDANPFIYAIEGEDAVARPLNDLFALFRQRPGMAITSELTLAEVLPKARPPAVRRAYLDLIVWSGIFDLKPVTRGVLVETADYRRVAASLLPDGRQAMPKLPDAIHVVTAIRSGCPIVLSTDNRLKVPVGVRLVEADAAGVVALTRELI